MTSALENVRDGAAVKRREVLVQVPAIIDRAGPLAVRAYVEFFLVSIRNKNTRSTYGHACSKFLDWCDSKGLDLTTVEPAAVAAYIGTFPGAIPSAKAAYSALPQLFKWLRSKQIISADPTTDVEPPRFSREVGATPVLSNDELRRLLAAASGDDLLALRDQALITALFYSFSRISALLAAKRGSFQYSVEGAKLALITKGGKSRIIPLHPAAALAMERYLLAAKIAAKDAPLMQAHHSRSGLPMGRALDRSTALKRLKDLAVTAGLDADKVCCHGLRATGITLFREAGGSLEHAQLLAGHASWETTKLYDRSSREIPAEVLAKLKI